MIEIKRRSTLIYTPERIRVYKIKETHKVILLKELIFDDILQSLREIILKNHT